MWRTSVVLLLLGACAAYKEKSNAKALEPGAEAAASLDAASSAASSSTHDAARVDAASIDDGTFNDATVEGMLDAGPGAPRDAGATTGGADAATAPSFEENSFEWNLPPGFPTPSVPPDNPMSDAKVELGRHLFYDTRLSSDGTASCASCHKQELAFTDGGEFSVGVTGARTPRSSMSLANVAYASTLTWANPLLLELERQALVPMFGSDPVELGLTKGAELEATLAEDPLYVEMFESAYPGALEPVTLRGVVQALAAFQRTLLSGGSAFDRYLYSGEQDAISAAARRGYELFSSERLECFHCHVGFNLTDHVHWEGKVFFDDPFHNTGLYDVDGKGAYPAPNTGVHSVTGLPRDMGRFKAPTLRNIAVTAPYMHDGSIATLSEVLDHYAAGGRRIEAGEHAGDGSKSPLKSNLVSGFELSASERQDVLEFLDSLTDHDFLGDPRFSDPWPR